MRSFQQLCDYVGISLVELFQTTLAESGELVRFGLLGIKKGTPLGFSVSQEYIRTSAVFRT